MNPKVFAFGVNYKALNSEKRARYSMSEKQRSQFFEGLTESQLQSLVIMNTCNRTEVYGEGCIDMALNVFNTIQGFDTEELKEGFIYSGDRAIQHIFRVASGLESQVIGDLEILGQFKNAFKYAKSQNKLSGFFERLANQAIHAAKQVRTQTQISSGTTSLSYAVVKRIKKQFGEKGGSILVVGMGNFGKNIAMNIADYLPQMRMSVCNRSQDKADHISKKIGCRVYAFDQLKHAIESHDIIVSSVQTNHSYLITRDLVSNTSNPKTFIDMSVPFTVDPGVLKQGHSLYNIDDMSSEINETLESRKEDIPIANRIVEEEMSEFLEWISVFQKSDSIKAWKSKVEETQQICPVFTTMDPHNQKSIISKSVSQFASFVKQSEKQIEDSELLINQFLNKNSQFKAIGGVCTKQGATHSKKG